LSKPVFRLFALRWFKKNCPHLITRWLFNQVRFEQVAMSLPEADDRLIDVTPLPRALPPLVEQQAAEINALRLRVGWLTLALIILMVIGGLYAVT
jgi:hypothetical protein